MLARPASIMAQQGSRNWVLAGRGAISAKTIARTAILNLCAHAQVMPVAIDCRTDCLSFPSFSFIFSILLFCLPGLQNLLDAAAELVGVSCPSLPQGIRVREPPCHLA